MDSKEQTTIDARTMSPKMVQFSYPHQTQHGFPPQGFSQQMPVPNAPPAYAVNAQQYPQIITQQPTTIFVQTPPLGSNPQLMVCPQCRATITSAVKHEPTSKTHLFAAIVCLLGGWCGCCLMPYCIDSCQGANHKCPNCAAFLGSQEY